MDAVKNGKAGRLLAEVLRFQAAVPTYRWAPFQRNHDQTRTMTALGNDVAGAKLAATILLTLPGVPFVYYGEEIGMTGDKPDERLRTPMQWERAPAAGFTRGKPWEALQPDSFTANVAVEGRDTASLLSLYRRLMTMRATKSALRNGELVPVETGNESLLAYIRRDRTHAMLVVANLGDALAVGVPVPKRYRLLGAAPVALDPRRAYIFDLVRSP